MRAGFDAEALLTLWECALGQGASARYDALLRASFESTEPARTLGERNARLMELHARLFEREIELLSHCPACGSVAQFTGDCEALAVQMRPTLDNTPPHRLEGQGTSSNSACPTAPISRSRPVTITMKILPELCSTVACSGARAKA